VEQEFLALKTVIERRSQQDMAEIKSAFAKAEPGSTSTEPIRILHLSDLHITADENPSTRLQPLLADLRDTEGGFGFERLDYLVLSGDLTNRATPEEFDEVYQLISRLIERFELSAERCVIVPGNHDLSWNEQVYQWRQKRLVDVAKQAPGTFVPQGDGYLVRDEEVYPQRFLNFGKFYHSLVQQPYPLKAEEQGLSFLFPDTRLQFLALNSAWEIDEFYSERSRINDSALASGLLKADAQIKKAQDANTLTKDASILRIAVWHHPATGNEKIVKDAFLELLRQANVQLCLHGHVHEERADLVGYVRRRKIHIAGAGSFGAVAKDRPESTPRLYNLLEIARDHSWVKVHTRYMRKDGGAWEGWAVWPGAGPYNKQTYYEIKLTGAKG
jgi:Icc-related predicted phosphoesterase